MNSKFHTKATPNAYRAGQRSCITRLASLMGVLIFSHACSASPIRGAWKLEYRYLFDIPVHAKLDFDRKLVTFYNAGREAQVPIHPADTANEFKIDLGFGEASYFIKQDGTDMYLCGKATPIHDCLKLEKEK